MSILKITDAPGFETAAALGESVWTDDDRGGVVTAVTINKSGLIYEVAYKLADGRWHRDALGHTEVARKGCELWPPDGEGSRA